MPKNLTHSYSELLSLTARYNNNVKLNIFILFQRSLFLSFLFFSSFFSLLSHFPVASVSLYFIVWALPLQGWTSMYNLHKHAITHHHLHRGNLKPELSLLSSSFYFPFLFSFGSLFDQWVWELKNEIFYLDLVVKVWKEGILVWICVWFRNGFEFVIWFWVCGLGIGGCGSGCGRWWLVAVSWVGFCSGFCSGFQFVSQWVSVCFAVGFGGQWAVG